MSAKGKVQAAHPRRPSGARPAGRHRECAGHRRARQGCGELAAAAHGRRTHAGRRLARPPRARAAPADWPLLCDGRRPKQAAEHFEHCFRIYRWRGDCPSYEPGRHRCVVRLGVRLGVDRAVPCAARDGHSAQCLAWRHSVLPVARKHRRGRRPSARNCAGHHYETEGDFADVARTASGRFRLMKR